MRRRSRDAWERELDATVSALTGEAWTASKPSSSTTGSRWSDKGSFSPGGGGLGESPQPDPEYPISANPLDPYPISDNPLDPGGGGDGGGVDESPPEVDFPEFDPDSPWDESCCVNLFDEDGNLSGMDCSSCESGDSGGTGGTGGTGDTGTAGFYDPMGTDDPCGAFGLRC